MFSVEARVFVGRLCYYRGLDNYLYYFLRVHYYDYIVRVYYTPKPYSNYSGP